MVGVVRGPLPMYRIKPAIDGNGCLTEDIYRKVQKMAAHGQTDPSTSLRLEFPGPRPGRTNKATPMLLDAEAVHAADLAGSNQIPKSPQVGLNLSSWPTTTTRPWPFDTWLAK
jgi:hypothetical protein